MSVLGAQSSATGFPPLLSDPCVLCAHLASWGGPWGQGACEHLRRLWTCRLVNGDSVQDLGWATDLSRPGKGPL